MVVLCSILRLLISHIVAINFNSSIFVLPSHFFCSSAIMNVWTCTYNQDTLNTYINEDISFLSKNYKFIKFL